MVARWEAAMTLLPTLRTITGLYPTLPHHPSISYEQLTNSNEYAIVLEYSAMGSHPVHLEVVMKKAAMLFGVLGFFGWLLFSGHRESEHRHKVFTEEGFLRRRICQMRSHQERVRFCANYSRSIGRADVGCMLEYEPSPTNPNITWGDGEAEFHLPKCYH